MGPRGVQLRHPKKSHSEAEDAEKRPRKRGYLVPCKHPQRGGERRTNYKQIIVRQGTGEKICTTITFKILIKLKTHVPQNATPLWFL